MSFYTLHVHSSALPALKRLFDYLGLEMDDPSAATDGCIAVNAKPHVEDPYAQAAAVGAGQRARAASDSTAETYDKGEGVLSPERLNLRDELEER